MEGGRDVPSAVLRVLHALDGDGPDEGLEDGQEVRQEGRVLRHCGKGMRRSEKERGEGKGGEKGRGGLTRQDSKCAILPSLPPSRPTCRGERRLNHSVAELRQHDHLVLGRHARCNSRVNKIVKNEINEKQHPIKCSM